MARTTPHNLTCPACLAYLVSSTAVSTPEAVPKEGDGTVCARCGAILTFTKRGLRIATVEDLERFPEEAALLLQMSRSVREKQRTN